jgi:multidrug efflux system membrane fusion protein
MPPNEHPSAARVEPALAEEPSPRRRRWLWIVAAVALVVVAGAAWYWWGRPAGAPAPTPGGPAGRSDPSRALPVVAVPARKGSIDVYLSALGTVTPRNTVSVRSRVDGQLMRVLFTEGQIVQAGALLAEIDPRPFQAQLAQAQGQQAKDAALLKNAQLDLERYRTLLSQDSISKQQVDTQESLVRQYEGTVKADQGLVDTARLQVAYSRITAPVGGQAGLRQVDPGNIVHASDSNGLVVITQMQPMTVIFPVPEDNLPQILKRIKSGESIPVEAWDRSQKVKLATGKLLTVDNQIDTATGTVKLRAEFPNTDNALYPNQFVNVRMLVDTRTDATLVPSAAIQRGAPGTFVYVVKSDSTVAVAPVKLGPVQGETTAIESGIAPGDTVVTDGTDKLREGAKVDVVTAASRTAPPPGASKRGPPDGQKGDGQRRRKGDS